MKRPILSEMSSGANYKGFRVRGLAVSNPATGFWTPCADVRTRADRRRLCLLRDPSHVYLNGQEAQRHAIAMAEIWIDGQYPAGIGGIP